VRSGLLSRSLRISPAVPTSRSPSNSTKVSSGPKWGVGVANFERKAGPYRGAAANRHSARYKALRRRASPSSLREKRRVNCGRNGAASGASQGTSAKFSSRQCPRRGCEARGAHGLAFGSQLRQTLSRLGMRGWRREPLSAKGPGNSRQWQPGDRPADRGGRRAPLFGRLALEQGWQRLTRQAARNSGTRQREGRRHHVAQRAAKWRKAVAGDARTSR
jgi:hypothetical protein